MKISTLSFTNKTTDWKLEPISFEKLTLLVGASGVGKTRILKCILDLKKITKGESLNGIKWFVRFSTKTGTIYQWEGEFENKGLTAESVFGFDSEMDDQDKPKIEREKLLINDQVVIDRTANEIIFNGIKTVKLAHTESVISLLKEEDEIKEVYTEFNRIIFDNNAGTGFALRHVLLDDDIESKLLNNTTLNAIRECNEDIRTKLYFTYINQRTEFDAIVDAFMDVFPYVEEIKVEPLGKSENIPRIFREIPLIQIKEKGIDNWIDETKLSSGMFRTLLHISELYLCADSSLILIDEFENSLGVNCIDELTYSIVSAKRDIQFILTSHHPYIINNISTSHWKLVSRKAGSVVAYDASQFNFDKSKHKAFTQLMNLDLYSEGANA